MSKTDEMVNNETENEKIGRQALEVLIAQNAKIEELLNRKEIIEFLGMDEIILHREAQRKIHNAHVMACIRFIKYA